MPCWYYDKKELRETPSILDGISFETERRYRKEGARFIMECGTKMGLGHNTMATGVVYFHRFYMFHSFRSFPRYVTACCCLFFAGKVEETPKKCRDIIKTARGILNDNYFYSFGEDPKEEVMTLERILLQTIKFDLQVEHPYTFLLKYAKCFKGDQQKLQKMVQMAWNFVNDSLSTVVCLQWEPEIIAVALIHLASKLSKFTVQDWEGRQPQHQRWWDMFVSDVTMEILEDICHQVLDLYQSTQKETHQSSSPPQKPPSRAESPTAVKSTNSTVIMLSSVQQQQPPPVSGNGNLQEVNNIQSIKSLAGGVPVLSSGDAPSLPQGPTPPGQSHGYHLYHAPPPPPPPVVPNVPYPTSAWGVQQTLPPPPMPPSLPPGPSGFYSTGGRQQQQRY
ncbi:cyclin-K [Drosophila takahashii]|uniref:cyclin-K n=1 Tax=Drosophila takahashii TaxID=29030 RepID=UPI0007E6A268|nr:cyclin-K [Drosophila takahashii]XP_016993491.1 cyclin-K [Drosophila takahashii]XP_016993499.1 cyclin-K [Drosophila takahashii]XP_016993508.1 cyclin-K [Drosophila takahashii]XP_016993515.1 cyclin-K [Drosophila takahashii]